MDFQTMQTEFFGRGFEYTNDAGTGLAQAKRWLNQALHEIDGEYPWPYLETTQTGAAPLSLTNPSGQVESVYDTTNDRLLSRRSRRELQEEWGDNLDQTGTPVYWYRTNVGTVNVYPVQAVSLSVRFFNVGTDLSANADTPSMPSRFHLAVVELAAAKAHRVNGNLVSAEAAQAEAQRLVDKMALELLGEEPVTIAAVGDDN